MTHTNFMAQLGAALAERGFPVLPIQPGTKKPGMYRGGAWRDYPKWTRHCARDTTEHEIDIWGDWPDAGIGIAAGKVVGVDIDVQDGAIADRVQELAMRTLGQTPAIRIGQAPKRLLVYRAAEPFAGFKYPPIEVLGLGQQFVAYGLHPETGEPYAWPVETLADLDLEDLPAIAETQARAFAEQAYQLIPADQRPKSLGVGRHVQAERPDQAEQRGTFAAVEEALRFVLNADLDYDSWIRIGLAIKGALGDEGWPLFEAWSASSRKNDPATPPRHGRASSRRRSALGPCTGWPWSGAGRRLPISSSTGRLR